MGAQGCEFDAKGILEGTYGPVRPYSTVLAIMDRSFKSGKEAVAVWGVPSGGITLSIISNRLMGVEPGEMLICRFSNQFHTAIVPRINAGLLRLQQEGLIKGFDYGRDSWTIASSYAFLRESSGSVMDHVAAFVIPSEDDREDQHIQLQRRFQELTGARKLPDATVYPV